MLPDSAIVRLPPAGAFTFRDASLTAGNDTAALIPDAQTLASEIGVCPAALASRRDTVIHGLAPTRIWASLSTEAADAEPEVRKLSRVAASAPARCSGDWPPPNARRRTTSISFARIEGPLARTVGPARAEAVTPRQASMKRNCLKTLMVKLVEVTTLSLSLIRDGAVVWAEAGPLRRPLIGTIPH